MDLVPTALEFMNHDTYSMDPWYIYSYVKYPQMKNYTPKLHNVFIGLEIGVNSRAVDTTAILLDVGKLESLQD